jgi:nicotinamide riboside transporter PnuC
MWVEPLAVFLAAIAVILQWREHRLAWWCVLLSSILYIQIFATTQLYWDAALQLVFIAIAIRGITSWGGGSQSRKHLNSAGGVSPRDDWHGFSGGSIPCVYLGHFPGCFLARSIS